MTDLTIPTARDYMTTKYVALAPEMDLLEAIRLMARKRVPGGLVLDDRRKLLGILTEKDCLRVLTVSTYHEASAGKVHEFMSPLPECADVDMDLFRVSSLFLETNFPILPVLDHEEVVGQISRQNLLQAIQAAARKIAVEQEARERAEEEAAESTRRPRSIEEMQRTFAGSTRDQLVSRLKRKG